LFQDLLAALRQCLLEYTQRLHEAEVDRHSLQCQLSTLLTRPNGVNDIVDNEQRTGTDQVKEYVFCNFNSLHLCWASWACFWLHVSKIIFLWWLDVASWIASMFC